MQSINTSIWSPYQDIIQALQIFRQATEQTIRSEDFDPMKISKILYQTLQDHHIDVTEIFTSPEKTKELLNQCLIHGVDQNTIYSDQLYHTLIGSTRKPYHDPYTDMLYTEKTSYNKHHITIDIEKLAHILIQHAQ
jgi:hypothetical protein